MGKPAQRPFLMARQVASSISPFRYPRARSACRRFFLSLCTISLTTVTSAATNITIPTQNLNASIGACTAVPDGVWSELLKWLTLGTAGSVCLALILVRMIAPTIDAWGDAMARRWSVKALRSYQRREALRLARARAVIAKGGR